MDLTHSLVSEQCDDGGASSRHRRIFCTLQRMNCRTCEGRDVDQEMAHKRRSLRCTPSSLQLVRLLEDDGGSSLAALFVEPLNSK